MITVHIIHMMVFTGLSRSKVLCVVVSSPMMWLSCMYLVPTVWRVGAVLVWFRVLLVVAPFQFITDPSYYGVKRPLWTLGVGHSTHWHKWCSTFGSYCSWSYVFEAPPCDIIFVSLLHLCEHLIFLIR